MAIGAGAALIALAGVAWFTLGSAPDHTVTPDAASPQAGTTGAIPPTPPNTVPSTPVTSPTPSLHTPGRDAGLAPPATAAPIAKARKDASPPPQKMQRSSPRDAAVHARCGDILQKASLETLDPEETDFLKKECR